MNNKKLMSTFLVATLVLGAMFFAVTPTKAFWIFGDDKKETTDEDFKWVTSDRIGNPNAEIVLTANIQRFDTIRTPFDTRKKYIREKAKTWAKNHPNARIDLQVAPPGQTSATMSKIITQAESGNAPDFAHMDSFWIGRFIDRGLLQPLNDDLEQETIDDFYGFTKDVTMKNGKQYAIWTQTDARFLYYRKDLIENPPETWKEVIETALKMKKEHGVHGYLAWLGTWEGAVNGNVWPYFWAQGGQMFNEAGKPVICEGKNREALANTLGFLKELVDTGAAPRMVASMTSVDPILAEVKANNVAMVANGNWFYDNLKDTIDNAEEKWDFVPLPQMKKGQRANSNGGWTYGVFTEDPKKQKLATDYIMTMLGSVNSMGERCKIYNYLPTRKSVYEKYPYFSQNPVQKRFSESLKYGNARPSNALYGEVSTAVQEELGKLLTGRTTVEKAVNRIEEKSLKAWEKKNK